MSLPLQDGTAVPEFETFTTSETVAACTSVLHHNMLRTMRRFAQLCPDGIRRRTKGPLRKTGYDLSRQALRAFCIWLVGSLKGHDGVQEKRRRDFVATFGDSCGLLAEDPQPAVIPWNTPEGMTLLTLDGPPAVQLSMLAESLHYSEEYLRKKLAAWRAEMILQDSDDFLRVTDGMVTPKTALYMLQMLPGAAKHRLQVFNIMHERLRVGSAAAPAGEFEGLDLYNPAQVMRALERVASQRDRVQSEALHASRSWSDQSEETQKQVAGLRADLEAAKAANDSLRVSLTGMKREGHVAGHDVSDEQVYSSQVLREEHHLVTIMDVVKHIRLFFGRDMLYDMFKDEPTDDRMRYVLRYCVGYKLLRADGAPVIRDEWLKDVRRFRVHLPVRCSSAHQVKHGEEKTWNWSLWFTKAAVALLSNRFPNLVAEWIKAEKPTHMKDKESA